MLAARTETLDLDADVTVPGRRRCRTLPDAARAVVIGVERTTVIVVEGRDGRRDAPGEVLRTRHVGYVRLLAGDGNVLSRRRIAVTPRASGALAAVLAEQVREAVAEAPGLTIGVVHDAGDAVWAALGGELARLAIDGAIAGWCEAIDRGALRARLARTLAVVEPDPFERDELLDDWDLALDADDDAVDEIAAALRRARRAAARPAVVDAQVAWLAAQRSRLCYATLARAGLRLRAALPPADELRPRVPRE